MAVENIGGFDGECVVCGAAAGELCKPDGHSREQRTRLACACGATRDAARDGRLQLISTLRFVLVEPAPFERRDRMLRVCAGCGCTYFPPTG